MDSTYTQTSANKSILSLFTRKIVGFITDHLLLILAIVIYMFLFSPIIILIVYSFNDSQIMTVLTGFTLRWYQTLFQNRDVFSSLTNSLIVGVSSAVISTAIGTMTAIVLVRHNFWGKQTFSTLILAPLILPEVVLAVALLVFLVFLKIQLSYFTIIAGHILLSLPRSTLVVRASAAGLDVTLEEAAADLGANAWEVFRHVTFPLLIPGILASLLLTFTLSFDNFVITMFVAGVGTTTLPLQIFSMMRFGTDPQINALGTILIASNLLLVFAIGGKQLQRVMGGGMQR